MPNEEIALIYLSALLIITNAILVFHRGRGEQSWVLALFLLSCALYLLSAGPVVTRQLTLPYDSLRLLVNFHYVASAGLIALVHYSLVFPEHKQVLDRLPVLLPLILYSYSVVCSVLYLSGTWAFATTVPAMFFWIGLMLGAFLHSLAREKDAFLKKQIALSLIMPILAGIIYATFNVLPSAMGTTPMRFTYFAMFSVILAFAMTYAIDNMRLYRQRVETEVRTREDREKVRRDLHDNILNRLARISVLSDSCISNPDSGSESIHDRLRAIKNETREQSRHIRGLLWVTDESICDTWENFCGQLRQYGYEVTENLEMDFDMEFKQSVTEQRSPTLPQKICLYHVFIEALSNVINHAQANCVRSKLFVDNSLVSFEVCDNGRGFSDTLTEAGHYGLGNMKHRVQEVGGEFMANNLPNGGACIAMHLPH